MKRRCFSIEPVFKPQAGDLGKVHGVAGEGRGVVGQGDAGDFQVHGAYSDPALLELKIACIAITHDATLLTRNTVDFAQVPGLRFENWLD